jgi:hypothetical protein
LMLQMLKDKEEEGKKREQKNKLAAQPLSF